MITDLVFLMFLVPSLSNVHLNDSKVVGLKTSLFSSEFKVYENGEEVFPEYAKHAWKEVPTFALEPTSGRVVIIGELQGHDSYGLNVFLGHPDGQLEMLFEPRKKNIGLDKSGLLKNGYLVTFGNSDLKPVSLLHENEPLKGKSFLKNSLYVFWVQQDMICIVGKRDMLLLDINKHSGILIKLKGKTKSEDKESKFCYLPPGRNSIPKPFLMHAYPEIVFLWAAKNGVYTVDKNGAVSKFFDLEKNLQVPGLMFEGYLSLKAAHHSHEMIAFPRDNVLFLQTKDNATGILFDMQGKPMVSVWGDQTKFQLFANGEKTVSIQGKKKKLGVFNLLQNKWEKQFRIDKLYSVRNILLGEDLDTVYTYSKIIGPSDDHGLIHVFSLEKESNTAQYYLESPKRGWGVIDFDPFIWGNHLAYFRKNKLYLVNSKGKCAPTKIEAEGLIKISYKGELILGEIMRDPEESLPLVMPPLNVVPKH